MIGNYPTVLNFNRLFLKLNRFICNYCRFSPIIGLDLQTLGSQPVIMPKNLPDHWIRTCDMHQTL